jgi:K+-sensing histidine kinase KdpD
MAWAGVSSRGIHVGSRGSLNEPMFRGEHKILLGMAVGVGKTCRMLQEGHLLLAEGRDVAIGLLKPHGRAVMAAMAEGLELIPRDRASVGRRP